MMRKLIFLFIITTISHIAVADNWESIKVSRSINLNTETIYVFPINFDSESLIMKDVWRSQNGIECSILAEKIKKEDVTGSFTCVSPEGYKAQITYNCSKHTNQKNGAYLFFGLVGKKENIGNFYVWCE